MALKKPSDLFDKTAEENNIQIIESDNTLREELVKVENLSEQVIQLQQELSQKVIKNDLESLVLSQINTMQENFDFLQNDFKKSNKKDIVEFKKKVSELTEIVGNLVENELPKYRKQVTKNEVVIDEKFNKFIIGIRNEIDTKVNDIAEVIDTNLEYFNTQLQETSSESKKTSDTYNKLSKIVENRISKENDKLDEYSQVIRSLHNSFVELEESLQEKTLTYNQIIEDKFETISSDVNNKINSIDEDVDTFKTQVSSDILSIKADVVINEQHIKNVDKYIQENYQDLVELKEEVFGEIEKLPLGNLQENLERLEKKIDYIKETYSKIEPEVIVKEVIKEGLLNEPPDTKNSDPLTPLDQKFVTLDQLQQHYRLFINRIQQQISTIGGGGETRLKYLDDIVGIATNASAYDGKYLKYNHSLGKFEFTDVDISNDSWADGALGPYTLGSVGIGTTTPTSKLDVVGDARITGVVTATTFVGALTGTATSTTNIPNLTGAITSNNTTTSLGSFSSANLATALTDETGTGVAVFATSPTLVTPALGAATATSIVVSSGSTFTNGPILVGTATSTGTASQPLQVTGGAYVSGVGVATGSIGVGITNPQGAIDIRTSPQWGATNIGANLVIGGTRNNALGILDSSNSNPWAISNNAGSLLFSQMPALGNTASAPTEAARITTNRNLLIGALTETGTASQRLQVTGGAYVSVSVGIGTTNPVATLQVKDALAFETTNTTTTSTSQVAVDTFATATFRSAKYQVQMTCPGQLATLGGITTGGSGYTAGTFNVTFSNSSGTGAAAQGTLTISNGTVSQIGLGTTGGSGYTAGDVLTAAGGSGLQVSVASTASPSGAILTLGAITSAGIGYTSGVGVGTTTLAFLGGTGTGAVGLATIFDGVITSSTLLQQPTTGTGGTVFYSGSNYTTSTVLTIAKTDVTNTITDIAGSVGVSTFTSLTAHGIGVSDTVRVSSTSNGLTAGTNYFVVTTPTTTTFTLGSSVGIGTTFTTGSSLSLGFYRNSANAGGSVAYLNAITGVSTNFQVSDLMVLQNGTTADFVEYGTIANNDVLGTFAADISGANTRLLVTPTYATNTVKVARQAITV